MKPTLLVLAAGMGSRYGGLKQLDGVGPDGQTIMDYSVYDAMHSGFGKVVFVIRKDFESQFREKVLSKYENHIPVEVVFQEIDKLPEGYAAPQERTRPWGTNHAVLMGRDVINEPFAVINSDDFYGRDAFRTLAEFFASLPDGSTRRYGMVAFNISNTTTENGTVSRGVCSFDSAGRLTKIIERHNIGYDDKGGIQFVDENGDAHPLDHDTPVSMNFWGFTPDYFEFSEKEFKGFLDKYIDDPKREFYIPSVVDKLRGHSGVEVDMLGTDSQWFGVTYSQDRDNVRNRLRSLHDDGTYPADMFA